MVHCVNLLTAYVIDFTSFVDHLCFLCLVFLMLLHLFIAAMWSPAGKGLTSWLLLVMFIVFMLLSHVVSWVRPQGYKT